MVEPADPAFGLKISPGVVLRNLLQQYPSGGQFFLEALQNADDTGRAGKFCALLDLRQHPAGSLRAPVKNRALLQQQAIVFYDDAGFKQRDWRSLQFMCDSVKRQSPHEQGAFGMGSRSFFHITDVLQVLSGTKLAALDPDDLLETGHFGEQVDFAQDGLVDAFPDEGAPFLGMFGCDMRSNFKGSLIRASLRTKERAQTCTFMPQAFEITRAMRIFKEFEETMRNGEVLLFLTSVKSVELWRWDEGSKEPSIITRTRLGVSSGHMLPKQLAGPGEVKAFLERYQSFTDLGESLRNNPEIEPPEILDLIDMETEAAGCGTVFTHKWLRCGSFSKSKEDLEMVDTCCCVPMTALALPIGGKSDGCLFASLPLPLATRLPVHVNAYFRLHDNRRAIWRLTPDLDGEHKLWAQWNERILTQMVPRVYSQALELLAKTPELSTDHGHSLWPREKDVEKDFLPVMNPLVNLVKDLHVLPTPLGEVVKPVDAIFFVTPTAALEASRQRLLRVCAEQGWKVVDPPDYIVELLHSRKALAKKPCVWVLQDVLLPAASKLPQGDLVELLLPFIEWAGSWKEAEIKDLGKRLSGVDWLPTEDGVARSVANAFDPAKSPDSLRIVRERRAKIAELLTSMNLNSSTVWRVLQQCGLKTEITWEDAVEEAEVSISTKDVDRARELFIHVNKRHSSMRGGRVAALKQLQGLPWAPAVEASTDSTSKEATTLLALKEVFPPATHKLVWAVAPTLFMEVAITELKPIRAVEAEPEVLIEQVRALADAAAKGGGNPPHASAATLEHLRTVFASLLPLLSKLPSLSKHPRLVDVAYVPCTTLDSSGDGAELFRPQHASFQAQHKHSILSPVLGIVKPNDATIRTIAEAAGVAKEPRPDILAEALAGQEAMASPDLAVALAVELAARLRAKCQRPPKVMVPTTFATIQPVEEVFIDDATWRTERKTVVLHGGISEQDGQLLGCTSLRQHMARQCEEGVSSTPAGAQSNGAASGGGEDEPDPFGNGADLMSQVRRLLQECGDGVDIFSELLQHFEAAGAGSVAFLLHEEAFGTQSVLDLRTAALQGPALYVCCDCKPTSEDVAALHKVADPKRNVELGGSGRNGVGLDIMYRYCDCPQLVANGALHFFDLTRSFVAKPGLRRGRRFTIEKLRHHFPDTFAPFDAIPLLQHFPTVFRLVLRPQRSDLGLAVALKAARAEMRQMASAGQKLLLFKRNLHKLEFLDGGAPLCSYSAAIDDTDGLRTYFAGLGAPSDLKAGDFSSFLSTTTITTKSAEKVCETKWVVARSMGAVDEEALKSVKEQPSGTEQLPVGAAAVLMEPLPVDPDSGHLCATAPMTFKTNASIWIHSNFAFPPSRKALPLPEEKEAKPSPDKVWNRLLLQGPVAESARRLVVHCTGAVLRKSLKVQHYFALFPSKGDRLQALLAASVFDLDWLLFKVILPEACSHGEAAQASMILALLEWAGSWKETEIRVLGKKLSAVNWLPTEDGSKRTIEEAFEPEKCPADFCVVRARRAKIGELIADAALSAEAIWRVLQLCGLKREMAWEDVAEEAETIVKDADIERGKMLLTHINKRHTALKGTRSTTLEKLQTLAWLPAKEANVDAQAQEALTLLSLKEVFPPSASKLIWAVAPSLLLEPSLSELKPGRTVEKEPEILVEQVRALVQTASKEDGKPAVATAPALEHLRSVFAALLPLLSKLPNLGSHPRLEGLAFVPCLPAGDVGEGAALFQPRCAAFKAQHAHHALSPLLGVVKQSDQTIRMIAEAAGVAKEPRAEVLAEALQGLQDAAAQQELGVALAIELAARLRAKEPRPARIAVPTALGTIRQVEEVYIDDAPWRQASNVVTLHSKISAEDGRLLGCTSLREAMARQSEANEDEAEEDAFGPKSTDLVSQVRQLLQEYSDGADIVGEFARVADEAGAGRVAFFLAEEAFGVQRVVDPRTSSLQGAALYICSDWQPSPQDVAQMQRVGMPAQGLGLAAMYKYCDCPQLLANNLLHFFDLTRGFVAKTNGKRACQFAMEKLRDNFPDSHAPFLSDLLTEGFPTVFRLALRTDRSDLGIKVSTSAVRDLLRKASTVADKMLLFSRHLRHLEFRDGATLIAEHKATVKDLEGYKAFFASLPETPSSLQVGEAYKHLAEMAITSVQPAPGPANGLTAQWVLTHHVGVATETALAAVKAFAGHGLPHGTAALRVSPEDGDEDHAGRVCLGMPTSFLTNTSAWISGSFALPPSRKSLPLPAEKEQKASSEKQWNCMLLQGPVASSLRSLVAHCTDLVLSGSLRMSRYFTLIPSPGDRVQTVLAAATYQLDWMLFEVLVPAASAVGQSELAVFLLAFLEWAGSWKESEIRELGKKLATVKWIPTDGGAALPVQETFAPVESPDDFGVVKTRLASISPLIDEAGLKKETVWRVLHLCGMKKQMTWEDVIEEAEAIVNSGGVDGASKLLLHLNKQYASFQGARTGAIEKLKTLAWLPAKEPSPDAEPPTATALLPLAELFPPSASKLVWAVAPSLAIESTVPELKPGRSVESEPGILLEQIRALACTATRADGQPPHISTPMVEHLRTAFSALLPHLSKLPSLEKHEKLAGIAFVPCLTSQESGDGADLFEPRWAAFTAQHAHAALSPIIGLVKPSDHTVRMIAEAASVAKNPRAEVLAEALQDMSSSESSPDDTNLAVALTIELAARLRAKETRPERLMVPTVLGTVQIAEKVCIDDAPWRSGQREIITLHPRISGEDGRLLGCASLRDEMTRQCEEAAPVPQVSVAAVEQQVKAVAVAVAPPADDEGDAFGQEADLVSQVKQLLQEYGDTADLVKEFVQNCDDAGATHTAFFLTEQSFGNERIVDPRTASLQGPALYVCSDKALISEDIMRMQCVGSSKKRMEFGSSGRFGVGLNVMYRYCDCPQLLANNRLHFFDLTRSFVAKPRGKRGRQFDIDKVRDHFPDSQAPFNVSELAARFPTIFRLALRTQRSELGLKMGVTSVRSELQAASDMAEKMLLFCRNLTHLEFHDASGLISSHNTVVKDLDQYVAFFKNLPRTHKELKVGHLDQYLAQKTITTERRVVVAEGDDDEKAPGQKTVSEWAIAHRIGVTNEAMRRVLVAQYEQPHGVALLPHGAAAVQVNKMENGREDVRNGRICVGLPTPFQTNSCAWIHGNFALLSSRKTLPLPEVTEIKPTLDKQWNRMLIEGPVADSMRGLIVHCTGLVVYQGFAMERYFALFPVRADRLHGLLARSTFKAAMPEAVFPVARGERLSWVPGPSPTFICSELSGQLQDKLVADGMKLVDLPSELVAEYEEALGKSREVLSGPAVCAFLRKTFKKLHPGSTDAGDGGGNGKAAEPSAPEVSFEEMKLACLGSRDDVIGLLKFVAKGMWAEHCKSDDEKALQKFKPPLNGIPLLLTHAQDVTVFGTGVKFSSWRDILPTKPSLFIHKDAQMAVLNTVDATGLKIKTTVDTEIPGVRAFTLNDLMPHKSEVEASIRPVLGFMDPQNETLRAFWSLVADTYADKLQAGGENAWKAAVQARASGTGAALVPQDTSWSKLIKDWRVMPICSREGGGENGENIITLTEARQCVAVTMVTSDEAIIDSLSGILQECDVDTIQHDVMSDDRICRMVRTLVVCNNDDMLKLLMEKGNVERLSAMQRHELLAYFSMLCVKGGVNLIGVKKLPLFKIASVEKSFVDLTEDITYCAVDPTDPHEKTLTLLRPRGMVLLAWPTAQVKPIYEYCGVELCNGEEFMVSHIIPQLPLICAEDMDGSMSEPFLEHLHVFAFVDGSDKVKRAAADCEFVPSEDLCIMAAPRHFTSPAGGAAFHFGDVLSSYLPVTWMQDNTQHMELLRLLGMQDALAPSLIQLCAEDLDEMAAYRDIEGEEGLRVKSFELVEEFARASEEIWPKPRPGAIESDLKQLPSTAELPQKEDMMCLLRAAFRRILVARVHSCEHTKKDVALERNAKRQKVSNTQAEVELVTFLGTAFKAAKQVVWSTCPLEDHQSKGGAKDSLHLRALLEKHPKGMHSVFGCLTMPEHAPTDLVLNHLACICGVMQADTGEALVKSDSLLHDDLRACWKHLAENLSAEGGAADCASNLKRLRELPCVSVVLEDVADKPSDMTTLTLPRFSFFHLPLLKGKEANLRLYLRQVNAETSKEAAVFKLLGASERPRAADYSGASERVAIKATELGRTNWEWVASCLDACLRGVYEDLSDLSTKTGQDSALKLEALHLFTSAGDIKRISLLVWADEPRWLKRCEKCESLHFCTLQGSDQRDLATALVAHAGLRQLTNLVEEKRVADNRTGQENSKRFKDNVEQLVQSKEFVSGLHACLAHSAETSGKTMSTTIADVTMQVRTIKFKATGLLRSGLFWKPGQGHPTEEVISGSEQDQQVYFDEAERAVHIGDVMLGPNEDAVVAELVFALRRALPLMYQLDTFLLEAMLRCALRNGPAGIMPFLERREIKANLLGPRHLGPGDPLPEDLQDHVVWAMDATFGEGEVVTLLMSDMFIIAEVAKWPEDQKMEDGINKAYMLRISPETFEARKHFQVYKIRAKKKEKQEGSTDLVPVEEGKGGEQEPGAESGKIGDGPTDGGDDAKQLADVKQYLHEMGKMEPDDYKSVMRRLFKTWHPDKVGDTPIANQIFHLLRSHEQWYKRRLAGENVGDDSWLDKDDPFGTSTSKGGELLALADEEEGAAKEAEPEATGSWFFEFEREMMETKEQLNDKKKVDRGFVGDEKDGDDQGKEVKSEPQVVPPPERKSITQEDVAQTGASRIVDKQLSPRFQSEARVEFLVARRCMKEIPDMAAVPARCVWHCQQAVEMSLRAAMLRTCGLAEDETAGGAAHDLIDFIKRLKTAEANTEEQRRAQQSVPLTDEDVEWLKHAYLSARYPKPGRYGIPAMLYTDSDADRGLKLAEGFMEWAAAVEDLPDPSKFRRRRWQMSADEDAMPLQQESLGGRGAAAVVPPKRPRSESAGAAEEEVTHANKWARLASSQPPAAAPPAPTAAGTVASHPRWASPQGPPVAVAPLQSEASGAGSAGAPAADAGGMPKRTKRWNTMK